MVRFTHPTRLAWAIHRALSKDPSARFPDAATLRKAIVAFSDAGPPPLRESGYT